MEKNVIGSIYTIIIFVGNLYNDLLILKKKIKKCDEIIKLILIKIEIG